MINGCLSDTALGLLLSRYPLLWVICVYFPLSVSQTFFVEEEVLRWCDKRMQSRPGPRQDEGMPHQAIKVSSPPPPYKQVVMLTWTNAYYGFCQGCDVDKHLKSLLWKLVLNQWGVCFNKPMSVWTSSAHGNAGRQRTCYAWTWERSQVQHLSSCLVRSKLWIMNIAEVMGLWDSFITHRKTISQGGWAGKTEQPYASCFAL